MKISQNLISFEITTTKKTTALGEYIRGGHENKKKKI